MGVCAPDTAFRGDSSLVLATLTPQGEHTIRACELVFDKILDKRQNSKHHANFVRLNLDVINARRSPAYSLGPDGISSGFTTEADMSDDEEGFAEAKNCYFLSLDDDFLPRMPQRGWIIGKGGLNSRNEMAEVDLLLPDPAEVGPRTTSTVYPQHGCIVLNPVNQQLFLYARHKGIRVNDKALLPREQFMLLDDMIIRIGPFRFVFNFRVRKENELRVQGAKKIFIRNYLGNRDPHDSPSPTPSKFDLFIEGWSLNGIAGWTTKSVIYTAIHERSGHMLAAKRLRLNRGVLGSSDKELATYESITEGLRGQRYGCFVMRLHSVLQAEQSVTPVREVYMLLDPYVPSTFSRFGLRGDWFHTEERIKKILFVQVCLGVETLHKIGFVHRDLKPSNLGVVDLNTDPQARVIDLESAMRLHSNGEGKLRAKAGSCGTVGYLAPELENSAYAESYGEEVDVWSLGAVAYFLFFGGRILWSRTYNMFVPELEKKDPSLSDFRAIMASLLQSPRNTLRWLVGTMLIEDPKHRPNITQILAHETLKDVRKAIDFNLDSKDRAGDKRKIAV